MARDVFGIERFYHTDSGQIVTRSLRSEIAHLSSFWTDRDNNAEKLAVGFPFSVLNPADLPSILMPHEIGALSWASKDGVVTASIDSSAWPIASDLTDALLIMHALEFVGDKQTFLDEANRVLTGLGELILIVPHRHGFWSRAEATPFGQGTPFSRRQVRKYLEQSGFEIESIKISLHILPIATALYNPLSKRLDWIARYIFYPFGGVLIVRATKKVYSPSQEAGLALQQKVRQFIVRRPASVITSSYDS